MAKEVQYPINKRFAELRTGKNGRLTAEWSLTDTTLTDPVQIAMPPRYAVPIVFVPGIMGSNLCNNQGQPVWLLNAIGSTPVGLAINWSRQGPGARQQLLHPARTRVYRRGNVPKSSLATGLNSEDFVKRGWGEVSEASYHKFLLWLDQKMNGNRNPANWDDFSSPALAETEPSSSKLFNQLTPGLVMNMPGLPRTADAGATVDPVRSDELLMRAKATYPIYASGYNWLDSNSVAARLLKSNIESIIAENNGPNTRCNQVILVTHSMGGLVARACAQLPGMSCKILGIVHGVMPATGAAVAYRRCKVGMRDEDFAAGLVIGSTGPEVTAVFAQSPGALQLLPSEEYGTGWLSVCDSSGNTMMSLPKADPYKEIYLEKKQWWGLIREDWLAPPEGSPLLWDVFVANIEAAKKFHRQLAGAYHHNTYVFYGGGQKKQSFQNVRWRLKKGSAFIGKGPSQAEVLGLSHTAVRTDGSNHLYVGGTNRVEITDKGDASFPVTVDTHFWELYSDKWDSEGDGTVPASSGRSPRIVGGKNILQQFPLANIKHEPAYRDYAQVQQVTYYAITKLSALADFK